MLINKDWNAKWYTGINKISISNDVSINSDTMGHEYIIC